jgi:hypothetical protein
MGTIPPISVALLVYKAQGCTSQADTSIPFDIPFLEERHRPEGRGLLSSTYINVFGRDGTCYRVHAHYGLDFPHSVISINLANQIRHAFALGNENPKTCTTANVKLTFSSSHGSHNIRCIVIDNPHQDLVITDSDFERLFGSGKYWAECATLISQHGIGNDKLNEVILKETSR